jgi:ABC-type phosphate/phosphonate transport system substrate-binding protein
MLRKVLVIVAVTAISVFCLSGCKKRSSEAESGQEALKTMAEYEVEAKKQINKENMAEELERIEKTLEQELSEEQ